MGPELLESEDGIMLSGVHCHPDAQRSRRAVWLVLAEEVGADGGGVWWMAETWWRRGSDT